MVESLKAELESMTIDIKRAKYDKLDLKIEFNQVVEKNEVIERRLDRLEPEIEGLLIKYNRLKNTLEIQNALDMQDHIDRERISLFGVMNHGEHNYPDGAESYNIMGKGVKMQN